MALDPSNSSSFEQLAVSVCLSVDVCLDWSDHALWWPDKNFWLLRTRSTLDQYGVQADAKLVFTTMHKNLRVLLPDLQDVDVRANFSSDVFTVVVKLCKEFGQSVTIAQPNNYISSESGCKSVTK